MDYQIVIDPSHGGEDIGNSGNGVVEKDLMLQISKYMKNRFESMGVPIVMIREEDEMVSPDERIERIKNAYSGNESVIVLSNHLNAGGEGFSYHY